MWNDSHAMWRGIKRSYKKINGKMKKIRSLFQMLTGDLPSVIIRLILSFFDPGEFLSDLLTKVVTSNRDLKYLYRKEYNRNKDIN